jgi:biopolymer transport protein ExbB
MSAGIRNIAGVATCCVLTFFALALGPTMAATNDLEDAILQTQRDIKTALADLNALRRQVETQRVPIAETHEALRTAVRKKRQAVENLHEAKSYGEEQRRALDKEVLQLKEECRFVLTALSEYRRGLETRVTPAEVQHYRPMLESCDNSLATAADLVSIPAAAEALLPNAVRWSRTRIGGYRIDGTALNSVGIEEQGAFLLIGPACYFANSNGVGGIVLTRFGSLSPTYFDQHTPQEQSAIASLLAGAPATVPLDVSNGDALKIAAAGDSMVEHIGKGGFVMVPLLLIGALALALTLWKLFELRGMRLASTESLDGVMAHLKSDDVEQAMQAAHALHKPLSTLIAEALTYRDSPREHLEEILHERILGMVPGLERHLGTLAVFGGVAPLLGLLGTVTGMIHTFDLVTIFGTGEARLLSGGISEALITTKFGLAVAIPVLLVHAFLARRVRTIVGGLENAAVRFVNLLKTGMPTP